MNASFQLGRIRGISIGINWSLLLVYALIVWTLADGILPRENPGLGTGVYFAMAIVAATLFFASILAHELGHALVAQHEGMEIQGITLWLFGGVARFRGEFQSAGSEFRIAIAGPVVSLVIGLAAIGISWIGVPDEVDGVASWLGYINLLLLVFNLLPALPLDGGRIFRSILWHAKKDYVWATRLAARTGQVIGALIVGAGIALIVLEGAFGGAWLAVVGWFVFTAAGDERRAADRRELFGDLRVRDLMLRDPITVPPDATFDQLVDAMTPDLEHSAYPVAEGTRPIGLLPYERIVEAPREQWEGKRVRDFALPLASVPVLRSDTSLSEAAGLLGEGRGERGLVVDGERLVGLLALSDVLRALRERGTAPAS